MKTTFTLHSPETDTDYVIQAVAPGIRQSPGPWPAILFMDGDDQFSYAVAAYRKLRRAHAVPPLFLVGVGYGASYSKPANQRGRDYTPTTHRDEPTSGGADAFLKFLRLTLWPELARRYPLRADARGLAGHSLGSLLVLHAFFRGPLFFTHYLVSAPSIWWDHRNILRIAKRRRARNATRPAHLYLCVGEKDSESMLGDLTRFEQWLAKHPFRRLRVTSQRFPRHDHYNVLPVAFRAGLRALFGQQSRADLPNGAAAPRRGWRTRRGEGAASPI